MDGVQECDGICTVLTANDKETLDSAIAKRPGRIDRVFSFERPALAQRIELISKLCKDISLDAHTQEYLAKKTENFTPAQVQEAVFSLAISYCNNNVGEKPACLTFNRQEVDTVIGKIDRDNRQQNIGFSLPAGNTRQYDVPVHIGNEIKS